MKTVTVEVTEKHIKPIGQRCASVCMIDLALSERLGGTWVTGVRFANGTISGRKVRVPLSKRVQELIELHDTDKPVKPFSFRLRYDG